MRVGGDSRHRLAEQLRVLGQQTALCGLLAGLLCCSLWRPPPSGIGERIEWSDLPGWNEEQPAEAWPALLASCRSLPEADERWREVCTDASAQLSADTAAVRRFFETRLVPRVVYGENGATEGLITGYYEPLLRGSLTPVGPYRYPIFGRPSDLLTIDLAELYPELGSRPVRGRIEGNRVVPYPSRADIDAGTASIQAEPIVWVDDQVALFFLHIQGSGRVELPDGSFLYVGYADQNGHPYRAIGRVLIESGELAKEEVTLQSIRDWLASHPDEASELLNTNPSYIFFESRPADSPQPTGSLGVPLEPERSIAVDASRIPLGTPVWLDTTLPDPNATPYRRLMFAHDTGGAIRGQIRADVFFGFGPRAEELAGRMKQTGALYVIEPRPPQ